MFKLNYILNNQIFFQTEGEIPPVGTIIQFGECKPDFQIIRIKVVTGTEVNLEILPYEFV